MSYQERLLRVIPGGAHTYSRGYDQYPANAPQILSRGKGAYVFDPAGNRFLDYGMALRAVNIGYAEDEIDAAAFRQIQNGNNLTRASLIELEAAELLVELIDSVDMVKFTKNGSTSRTAAVKLARAYTGRELIARLRRPSVLFLRRLVHRRNAYHAAASRSDAIGKTKLFAYNDMASLEALLDRYPGQIACVVLEPAQTRTRRGLSCIECRISAGRMESYSFSTR